MVAERAAKILVIGAGFSGLGTAIGLREAGEEDVVVLEKAGAIGGTWRDNTYPGCACDIPSSVYSFSFAPNPDWSRLYAGQPEILAYLRDVAGRSGVLDRVHLDEEVQEAAWDDAGQVWRVRSTSGAWRARVLVTGMGPLHEPAIPRLPGLDRFAGTVFHSARWDHSHDLTGERVAVVGTGASAVQFVPEIQPQVGRLHVFQRTAGWVLPRMDAPLPQAARRVFRRHPGAQRALREAIYHLHEGVQLAQRHPAVMRRVQRLALRHLHRQVADPELRRALTPAFTLGCKRMLFSNDWYPALTRPNVELVPHAVREVTEHGVIGADGTERPVDTIIFGTGFHVTDPPVAEVVTGRDGVRLADAWREAMVAYKGTTVAGFPNLFLMVGPNLANGHQSVIVLVEAQVRYIVDALRKMDRQGVGSVEVRPEVQERWNDDVQRALAGTVFNAGGCASYYLDPHGRNAMIYPWTTIDLRRRTARFDAGSYVARPAAAA